MQDKTVLFAEDSENDVLLMQMAAKRAGITTTFVHVADGQEAIDYLAGRGMGSKQQPYPSLVITDLKMPRVNGFELLAWLGSRSTLRSIPVLVLTSSPLPEDRQRAEELGCRGYYVKPSSFDEMIKLVSRFNAQWIEHSPKAEPLPIQQPKLHLPLRAFLEPQMNLI